MSSFWWDVTSAFASGAATYAFLLARRHKKKKVFDGVSYPWSALAYSRSTLIRPKCQDHEDTVITLGKHCTCAACAIDHFHYTCRRCAFETIVRPKDAA